MWNGFRNYLVHRFAVEDGKRVLSHATFEPAYQMSGSVTSLLDSYRSHEIFKHDGYERNWSINCDVLHAKLPETSEYVCRKLRSNNVDIERLDRIVG
jgi:hypothetical protein